MEEGSDNLNGIPTNTRKTEKINKTGSKIRPPQALFDSEQATASNNGYVFRRHHPLDSSSALYDVWNGEYYRDGFLFKEMNVSTFIDNNNVKPTIEELTMFVVKKTEAGGRNGSGGMTTPGKKESKKAAKKQMKTALNPEDDDDVDVDTSGRKREEEEDEEGDGDNDDDDEEEEDAVDNSLANFNTDLAKEIAKLNEEEDPNVSNPFIPGDLVQIIGGEMINLVGRIISINDVRKTAKLKPLNNPLLSNEFDIELSLLVKYVYPGAHVKVMTGKNDDTWLFSFLL
jgi:hypothetical protein